MVRVALRTTARDEGGGWASTFDDYLSLVEAGRRVSQGTHVLVDETDEADLVVFVQPGHRYQRDVLSHLASARWPLPSFVFDTHDHPLPRLPGLYASVSRSAADGAWAGGAFYPRVMRETWLDGVSSSPGGDLLFSFVGAAVTHEVRGRIMSLLHPRCLLKDTSDAPARMAGRSAKEYEDFRSQFVESVRRSWFVLCPRGRGPSSVRTFEVMRAGRVPIIVSDAWTPPAGPDWGRCAVRVPERLIHRIPALLEELEPLAPAIACRARHAWETYFSLEHAFHWMTESLLGMAKNAPWRRLGGRVRSARQLLDPWERRYGWPRDLLRWLRG